MGSVDKTEFERIIGNLLRQTPKPRKESKTGRPKESGKIIPKTPPLVHK